MAIYSGIIFDLDGTLLDTLADIASSMNSVLQRHGFAQHETEKYKYFVGEGIPKLVENVLEGTEVSEIEKRQVLADMRAVYAERWNETTQPYEGIQNLFSELEIFETEIKLAVLSNKSEDFTKKMVDFYFPDVDFDLIVGGKDDVPKKPDPQSALHICHSWEMPSDQVLFVGDSSIDMQTAVNAGCFPVGVLWGFRTENELKENGAKILIKHPLELLKILS